MKTLLITISKGSSTLEKLAKSTGVSSDSLRSRVDTLLALGYLTPIRDDCEDEERPAWSGCATTNSCKNDPTCPITGWKISEKGLRFLN